MNEELDLVNDRGEVIHQAIRRDQTGEYTDARVQIVIVAIFNSLGDVLVYQRAKHKSEGGKIDIVSGVIESGQTPLEAAAIKAETKVGVRLNGLRVLRQGINEYGRYCYLVMGYSDDLPRENLDPNEVAWAAYMSLDELRTKYKSGELEFMDDFFDDVRFADSQKNEEISSTDA